MKRAAKIAGLILLTLGLPAFVWSVRRTPVGFGFRIPSVFAQAIFQQNCKSPFSPIVGPTWQVSNRVNEQFLQWGCLDPSGNLQIAGSIHIGQGNDLNTAITEANALGGAEIIISKPLNVSSNVTLKSNVTIRCTGWQTAPITWTGGTGPNAVFIAPNTTTDSGISGCSLIGPNATTADTNDIRGIELDGCTRCKVKGNRITGMSYGIFGTANHNVDIWVTDNSISTATTQGIVGFGSNWHISGNRIDSVGTTNLNHGIYVSGVVAADVSLNTISNTSGFCVHVFTNTAGENNEDIRVIGNSCTNAGQGTGGTNGGMLASFGAPSTFCRKIVFVGNTVDTATANSNDVGIQLGGCTESSVTSNIVKNVANHGIFLASATSDSVVSGNRVEDFNAGGGGASGIVLAGNALRNIVNVNVVSNTNATGAPVGIQVNAAGDTDNIISGNDVVNATIPITNNGTRTLVFGNKINATDALFRILSGTVSTTFIADQGTPCTNGELTLSAGWQSTGSATVTAVAGNGQTCSWTITTGTTTAASPTVTDTLTNQLPDATTICEMNIHGGTHTAAAGEGFKQTTLSATAPVFTFNGTPTAGGTTYLVTRTCGP